MKLTKLLNKAETLLNTQEGKRQKRMKNLRRVLKKLRKQERKLGKKRLKEWDPEVIKKIDDKITLAKAQRKKGIAILRALQEESSSD